MLYIFVVVYSAFGVVCGANTQHTKQRDQRLLTHCTTREDCVQKCEYRDARRGMFYSYTQESAAADCACLASALSVRRFMLLCVLS